MDLLEAVEANDVDAVVKFLEELKDTYSIIKLEETDDFGDTAFMNAVAKSSFVIAQLLVDAGADINHDNDRGETALITAAVNEKLDAVEWLLRLPNIDINISPLDSDREYRPTALLVSIAGGDSRIFKVLLADKRTDLNAPELQNGNTPLIYASIQGRLDMIYDLLDAGANVLLEDDTGLTAYDHTNDPVVKKILSDAEGKQLKLAVSNLNKKFVVARQLQRGTITMTGQQIHIPERNITEGIIRRAEYDNLCSALDKNTDKAKIQALARSLHIPLLRKSKQTLCEEISKKLIL